MQSSVTPEFVWHRPKGGQVFAVLPQEMQGSEAPRPSLVLVEPAEMQPFRPLESLIALYLELANCEPTADGALAFANRYGYLGLRRGPDGRCGPEPVADWVAEIARMREAVEIWNLLRKKSAGKLRTRFRLEGGVWRYQAPPETQVALGAGTGDDAITEGMQGRKTRSARRTVKAADEDVMAAALLFLHRLVNRQLARSGAFEMFSVADGRRSGVAFVPANLHGAIYLRFALAVSRRTRTRKCVTCGRHFELAPGTARSDRIFCSDACRSKAYRRRQEEARRLHAKGVKIDRIAARLGVDVETVRGWVDFPKGD